MVNHLRIIFNTIVDKYFNVYYYDNLPNSMFVSTEVFVSIRSSAEHEVNCIIAALPAVGPQRPRLLKLVLQLVNHQESPELTPPLSCPLPLPPTHLAIHKDLNL